MSNLPRLTAAIQITVINLDSRRARSEATKAALMRAAEQLIAEQGVENVSIRHIIAQAQQKNESALQYHFKNLTGLLQAIHTERAEHIQARRAELLAETLANSPHPNLRQLCTLMVEPAFQLARESTEFRDYIKAFGHQLALSDSSPLRTVHRKESAGHLGALLVKELTHLDKSDFGARIEAAIRLSAASMHHQARQKNGFRGKAADLFLHNLIDALFGLLSAPVSTQTRQLKAKR